METRKPTTTPTEVASEDPKTHGGGNKRKKERTRERKGEERNQQGGRRHRRRTGCADFGERVDATGTLCCESPEPAGAGAHLIVLFLLWRAQPVVEHCSGSRDSAQVRSRFGPHWPSWAITWPMFARCGQSLANFERNWPSWVNCWPNVANLDQPCPVLDGRDKNCPSWANIAQISGKYGQHWPTSAKVLPVSSIVARLVTLWQGWSIWRASAQKWIFAPWAPSSARAGSRCLFAPPAFRRCVRLSQRATLCLACPGRSRNSVRWEVQLWGWRARNVISRVFAEWAHQVATHHVIDWGRDRAACDRLA